MKNLLSLLLVVSFATASCNVAPAEENLVNQETTTQETKSAVVENSWNKLRYYAAAAVTVFGAAGLVVFRDEICKEVSEGMPATKGAFERGVATGNDVLKNAWDKTVSYFTTQADAANNLPAVPAEPVEVESAEADAPVTGHVHHEGCGCGHHHHHDDVESLDGSDSSEVSDTTAAAQSAPAKKPKRTKRFSE